MFSYADGMTMSAKKDGLVNMGGFIALNNEDVYKKAMVFNIMYEGFTTYGGMNGSVEIGTILADRDPFTHKNRYPELELVRLAIPRRTYSLNHMQYIAAVIKQIYDTRANAKRGYQIIDEAPIMRHFTVKLEKIES